MQLHAGLRSLTAVLPMVIEAGIDITEVLQAGGYSVDGIFLHHLIHHRFHYVLADVRVESLPVAPTLRTIIGVVGVNTKKEQPAAGAWDRGGGHTRVVPLEA